MLNFNVSKQYNYINKLVIYSNSKLFFVFYASLDNCLSCFNLPRQFSFYLLNYKDQVGVHVHVVHSYMVIMNPNISETRDPK